MIDIPLSYVKYDFNLEIMAVAGQYQFKFEYASDLFEQSAVERMAKHFMTLLAEVAGNPQKSLKKISLLTLEERNLILNAWNNTYRDFPLDKPFHHLFGLTGRTLSRQNKCLHLLQSRIIKLLKL